MSYHIISYKIKSYTILYYIISYHIILYTFISYYIVLCIYVHAATQHTVSPNVAFFSRWVMPVPAPYTLQDIQYHYIPQYPMILLPIFFKKVYWISYHTINYGRVIISSPVHIEHPHCMVPNICVCVCVCVCYPLHPPWFPLGFLNQFARDGN